MIATSTTLQNCKKREKEKHSLGRANKRIVVVVVKEIDYVVRGYANN
jgi:hypothetical protein